MFEFVLHCLSHAMPKGRVGQLVNTYIFIYVESRGKVTLTGFFLNELQPFEDILHYFVASTLNNQFYADL